MRRIGSTTRRRRALRRKTPFKDGLNWYSYVANNPLMFVDPWGLEYIVVSGGEYKTNDPWPYEFIEPAVKKIFELAALMDGESIKWIIADEGWSSSQKKKFQRAINDLMSNYRNFGYNLDVSILYITDIEQLINYINTKDGNRSNDKIKKFALFSHGLVGSIPLAYNYAERNQCLDFFIDDISKISGDAFENPNSVFYSCNTGTNDSESFAQAWVNQVGGTTWAFIKQSDYSNMNPKGELLRKISRRMHGFALFGSEEYPVPASNAYIETFTRE